MRFYPHIAIRIGARLKFEGDCWIYTAGHASRSGHVQVHYRDRSRPVHRVVWQLWFGPIPDGLCVLHRCDVPRCVNPLHLFLGTVADNNADRDAKGRHVPLKGVRNGMAKLTDAQVQEIRDRYVPRKVSTYKLADEYGVNQAVIWRIVKGLGYVTEQAA